MHPATKSCIWMIPKNPSEDGSKEKAMNSNTWLKRKIALISYVEWNYQLNSMDAPPSQPRPLLKEGKRRKRSFNAPSKLVESSIDTDC